MKNTLIKIACLLLWPQLMAAHTLEVQQQQQQQPAAPQQHGRMPSQTSPQTQAPAQPPGQMQPGMQMPGTPAQSQQPSPAPAQPQHGQMQMPAPSPTQPLPMQLPPAQLPKPKNVSGPTVTLEELLQMAATSNPTLAQARSEMRAAEGRKKQAGLYPNPTVGFDADEVSSGPIIRGGQLGFFVQQNIVTGGKLRLSREVFEQERRQAEGELEEQQLRVENGVRAIYYQTLAAQTMLDLRQELSRIAADAVETAKQLYNVGQADAPDLLQVEVEASRDELAVVDAKQNLAHMWRSLAATVGRPELQRARLAGDLESLPDVNTDDWLNRIVNQSPAVKIAELEVQRSEAALTRARREPIPDLQLRGGLRQNRELLEPTGRPIGLQGFAEVGVQIPIFNRNQGNVQAAQADTERARNEVNRVKLLLRERASSLVRAYENSRVAANRYKYEMIPRAQRAYELYLNKYGQMAAAYPQVLISQRTFFELQTEYVTALRTLWTNSVGIQSFMLTDGLEAPARPGEMERPVREINLPSPPSQEK